MLCEFCRNELLDRFESALEEPLTVETMGRVMKYLTPESFEKYKKEWEGRDDEDNDDDDDDYGEFDYEATEEDQERREAQMNRDLYDD